MRRVGWLLVTVAVFLLPRSDALAQSPWTTEDAEKLGKQVRGLEPGDPQLPEVLFRYARACEAEADAARKEAGRAHERGDEVAAAEAEVSASAWRLSALQAHERLVSNHPRHRNAERSTYVLALMASESGDGQGMARWARELIKNYPASDLVPVAYLLFGDDYFARGEFSSAATFYDKAAQFPDSTVQGYAHFKIGWCHLNGFAGKAPDGARALQAFQEAIQASPGQHQRWQRLAYRKDLVRAYALAGKPARAPAYFARVGVGPTPDEDDRGEMLDALEQLYVERGDPRSADKLRRAIKKAR